MEIQVASQANIQPAQVPQEVEGSRADAVERDSDRVASTTTNSPNGPAVVANISASALEASRATNASNNIEAQSQTNAAIAVETKSQTTPSNEQLSTSGNQTLQTSRVDTVV